jgi:hypothetical protein
MIIKGIPGPSTITLVIPISRAAQFPLTELPACLLDRRIQSGDRISFILMK